MITSTPPMTVLLAGPTRKRTCRPEIDREGDQIDASPNPVSG